LFCKITINNLMYLTRRKKNKVINVFFCINGNIDKYFKILSSIQTNSH
jgi:hypothetical protein